MKNRRHTPEQIVRKLREADRLLGEGVELPEVVKQLEVSEATYYRWRAQYGGMKANDVKRLKELEIENARLKRIVADQTRGVLRQPFSPAQRPVARAGLPDHLHRFVRNWTRTGVLADYLRDLPPERPKSGDEASPRSVTGRRTSSSRHPFSSRSPPRSPARGPSGSMQASESLRASTSSFECRKPKTVPWRRSNATSERVAPRPLQPP